MGSDIDGRVSTLNSKDELCLRDGAGVIPTGDNGSGQTIALRRWDVLSMLQNNEVVGTRFSDACSHC